MKNDAISSATITMPAWRVALVWAVVSALAAVAMTPYLLAILPPTSTPLPPAAVIATALGVQTGVMAFLLGWAGTAAGRSLGLGSPLLEARLRGERAPLPRSLAWAGLWGVLAGILVVVLDKLFAPWMPAPIGRVMPEPSPLHGLLASAYGGLAEEVLTRLGLATLLAWAVWRLSKGRRLFALVVGIVGASLLFGALHLPAASQIWPMSAVVITRTMLLNVVFGLVAGVIYVRRGLEHAMAAHVCADLVLHVIAPALSSA